MQRPDPAASLFLPFMLAWVALGVASWLWIRSRPSVEEKRTWMRRLNVVSGVVFGAFLIVVFVLWRAYIGLLIFLPFLALIIYLRDRFTFICDQCGKTSQSMEWFSSTYHCPKCGHKLR